MSETKKDNGFTRWSKKHAELWKFIKYSIAGGSSSAIFILISFLQQSDMQLHLFSIEKLHLKLM